MPSVGAANRGPVKYLFCAYCMYSMIYCNLKILSSSKLVLPEASISCLELFLYRDLKLGIVQLMRSVSPLPPPQIGDLEKELHSRQSLIKELQQRVGTTPPSSTTEIRRLRDELEDLRLEATKDKRLLTQEKAETERLVEELSSERLKVRQVRG